MSDLVKRLRNAPMAWKIRHEAADTLDAKDARIKALEAALLAIADDPDTNAEARRDARNAIAGRRG